MLSIRIYYKRNIDNIIHMYNFYLFEAKKINIMKSLRLISVIDLCNLSYIIKFSLCNDHLKKIYA